MKIILLTTLLFASSLNLFSQVPGTLSYQGILLQNDGITPLTDGAHSIVFSFYTVSSGGSALLTRTISVTTSRGLYTCIIGGGVAPNAPFNSTEMNQIGSQQVYIGIKVDAGTELLPRAQLTTAAYTFQAQSAYSISDNAVTSAKIVDGTITNADINASAAIGDSKLATVSTAGKVSGSAITSGTIGGSTIINTTGSITAGTITGTSYTGNGSGITNVNAASITDGIIVDADINASAAIADSKLATIATAGKVSGNAINSGTISGSTSINVSTTGNVISGVSTNSGIGSKGQTAAGYGVQGVATANGIGVYGLANSSGIGVYAQSQSGYGIYATSNTTDAGYFYGSVTVANGLYVTGLTSGTGNYPLAARSYFTATSSTSLVHDNTTTSGIAIRADGNILAASGAFIATSDKRIKEIVGGTNNEKDLSDLLKIEITDYRFIDKINNGDRLHKKVIAQQLQSVYPTAVNVTEGVVPNVFEVARKTEIKGNKTYIQTNKPHQFSSGDEVKLILENQGEKKYKVNVINENEFVVNDLINENVFVYGKKVYDLLSVDYDALTTLNISSTQALCKEIDDLKAKLLVSEQNFHENSVKQEAKIDELKIGNRNLLQRLELIESLLIKKSSGTINASK